MVVRGLNCKALGRGAGEEILPSTMAVQRGSLRGSRGAPFGRLKSSATKPIQAAAPTVMALSAALNTGKLNQP